MINRRQFVGTAALTALGYSRVLGASQKLRVASVGTGGKGRSDLSSVATGKDVQVAALCNIDETKEHLGWAALKFPAAKRFTDWRKLLEESKSFDALIVSTPDHMHAPIALPAIQLGKHIYCQKPLTHTIHEARQMRQAAKKYKIVTQMGNQIQSHEAYRTAVKAVHGGVIGKVKEVLSWQAGAMRWMLVDDRPAGADPVPKTVHWDHWLGVAPERPYKDKIYHPFNWRAWQDYSNGQLGDFGCHILDPVFMALKLTAPTTIRAESPPINREVWTKNSTVSHVFPGTEHTATTLKLTWFDGAGHYPPRDSLGLPKDAKVPGSGSVLLGEKGTLLIPHVGMPRFYVDGKEAAKLEPVAAINHYTGWADACRGEGKTFSSFDYSGPLTECVLLGTIAIRQPGATLTWNAEAMKLTGSDSAAGMLTKKYRKGWEPAWIKA